MTRVVNKKTGDHFDLYIGRGSKWGNPFIIGKDGDRHQVVEKYRQWILQQPSLMASLHELRGKTLGCFCKPALCHGDVLVELVSKLEESGTMTKTACFTGHRPDKLGIGYSFAGDRVKELGAVITAHVTELHEDEGVNTFISGGALGIDQIAFWAVRKLQLRGVQIKNVLAIPFEDQYTVWKNKELVAWYHKMIQVADHVVYTDLVQGYHDPSVPAGKYTAKKLQLRNQYMVDKSDYVIAFWDGTSGGTANCVKYAQSVGKAVITTDPTTLVHTVL